MLMDTLTYKTAVDDRAWSKGIVSARDSADRFFAKSGPIKLPAAEFASVKIDTAKMVGSEDTTEFDASPIVAAVDMVRSAVAGIGGDIRRTFQAAGPMVASFANDFAQKFDKLGPVLRELAIRIDDSMRFPLFEKRTDALMKSILKPFGMLPGQVGRQFDSVGETIGKKLDTASGKIKGWWTDLGKDIGGYDLLGGVHVQAGGFKSFMSGLDTYASDALDKMKAHAAAVMARPGNKGKGSRTAFNQRKAAAAQIAAMQANRDDADLVTPPTKQGLIGRIKADPGAQNAGAALAKVGSAVKDNFSGAAMILGNVARGAAIVSTSLIGIYRDVARGKNFFSSLGSVAKATWGVFSKIKIPKISFDPRQATILKGIAGAAGSLGSAFTSAMGPIAALVAPFVIVSKIGGFLAGGISGASNLNETLNKTDVILGKSAVAVRAYADEMADRFGLVKQDVLDVASGFGALFKNMGGLSGAALEAKTKEFTQAAADLSSQMNISIDEAGRAITSGLIGNESDVLRKKGIDYQVEATKAYAYAHSIGKVGEALTNEQELESRGRIVLAGLADARGDLANTATGTANAWRGLTGRLTNFANAIGTALIPAVDRGIAALNWLTSKASASFESAKTALAGFVEKASEGIDLFVSILANPVSAFEVVKLKSTEFFANVVRWLGVIPDNLARFADYIGKNWDRLLVDMASNTLTTLENITANIGKLGLSVASFMATPAMGFKLPDLTPLAKGFIHTAEKLPELVKPVLVDMSKEIATAAGPIMDTFAKRRADAMKAAPGMSEAKANAQAGLDKTPKEKETKEAKGREERQFAGAAELGSADAYTSLVRGLYGIKGSSDRQQINLLQQINNKLGQQVQIANRPAPPAATKPNGVR